MEEILGIEPRIAESNSAVLPLHHISMLVPLGGFEPPKLCPKRQIYSLLSLSILTTTTWLLGQDYDSQMLFELPKNMVTRGGIEPTVLAVKERCLSHLTNEPCWRMAQDLNLWS